MIAISEGSCWIGEKYVHRTDHTADHTDLGQSEANGFLHEHIKGSQSHGDPPCAGAKKEVPVIFLTVIFHEVGLDLGDEAAFPVHGR